MKDGIEGLRRGLLVNLRYLGGMMDTKSEAERYLNEILVSPDHDALIGILRAYLEDRNNALEEAAKLADKSAFDEITGLAEQIRALKDKQ